MIYRGNFGQHATAVGDVPHNRVNCRIRATEVASAAPQKSYHAMSSMLIGTFAIAVSTVMTAGAQTMFCTCMACKTAVLSAYAVSTPPGVQQSAC